MRRMLAGLLAVAITASSAAPAAAVVSPQAPREPAPTSAADPIAERAVRTTPATTPSLDLVDGPAGLDSGPAVDASTEIPGTPGGRGDWLANNGLSSPRCKGSRDTSCLDSGTRAIPAPPGHYSLDSWMESGPMGLPKWSNIVSELTGFVWSGIVTITVALFSALEWALNLDLTLVGDGALNQLAVLNSTWGMPLGVLMLTIGAIWVGIQARSTQRIGAALGSAGLGFLLMGLSVTILSNPAGTIGQVTALSGQLGREAATAPLVITDRGQTLDTGLERMWEVAITRPFGLLQFGDVDWATNPEKLDPELLKEARRIAREQGDHVVRRVAAAKTNADLHLVWPANGDVRNSKDADKCEDGPCLLNVLCGSDDMSECEGAGARLASQRTDAGVTDRLGEVLLVGIGMLSVWIVLGAIVFGLLWTSISVVVTLLELAFVWPLALTFKPEWRQKVSGLQLRLLGAALAKILFGVAAGITMTMLILIQKWDVGWVVQWILTVAGMFLLWQRRSALKGYMETLTGGEKTSAAAGGLAGRIVSSYATGAGIGAVRGRPGSGKTPGGGPATGGGVPIDLPTSKGTGRKAMLGAAVAGGALGGPVGSAAAVGVLKRQAIGAAGKAAAGKAGSLAGSAKENVAAGMRRTAGPTAAQQAAVPVSGQATALLATDERGAQEAAAQEAAQQQHQELADAQAAQQDAHRQHQYAQLLADAMLPGNPGVEFAQERLASSQEALRVADEHLAAVQPPALGGVDDAAAPIALSEPSARAISGAETWLDQQAATPSAERDYRRLAGVQGVTAAAFDAMPDAAQQRVRSAVDASLTARQGNAPEPRPRRPRPPAAPPSTAGGGALDALSRVASGQSWRQIR